MLNHDGLTKETGLDKTMVLEAALEHEAKAAIAGMQQACEGSVFQGTWAEQGQKPHLLVQALPLTSQRGLRSW